MHTTTILQARDDDTYIPILEISIILQCTNLLFHMVFAALNVWNPNIAQVWPALELPNSKYTHNKHTTLSNTQEQIRTVPHYVVTHASDSEHNQR